MCTFNEYTRVTLILNSAALVILFGVIWYTAVYRRRGKKSDRLYFAMAVLLVFLTVADTCCRLLDKNTAPYSMILNPVCHYVYFLVFEILSGIFGWYMLLRGTKDPGGKEKKWLIMLPALITAVLVLLSPFLGGAIFRVDPGTNMFLMGKMSVLVFAAPLFYLVLGFVMVLKIDPRMAGLFIMLAAVRLFFGGYMLYNTGEGIYCTMICLAVGLVFIHVHVLGNPFYEDEEISGDPCEASMKGNPL